MLNIKCNTEKILFGKMRNEHRLGGQASLDLNPPFTNFIILLNLFLQIVTHSGADNPIYITISAVSGTYMNYCVCKVPSTKSGI
jgi:hypothetical protein